MLSPPLSAGTSHAQSKYPDRPVKAAPDGYTVMVGSHHARGRAAETFPGYEAATWFVLVTPAGTLSDVIATINDEAQKIVATKDYQQRFDTLGLIPDPDRSPGEIKAYIRSEIGKWAKVIKAAGIKPAE